MSALLAETRRVLAVVPDTTYTVEAERAGLFAYGVTAVDVSAISKFSALGIPVGRDFSLIWRFER